MKLALSLALLLPAAALGQSPAAGAPAAPAAPAAAKTLPPASTVLAKFREARGNRAWLAAPGVTSTGTFEMPAAGIKASFELLQAAPNRMRLAVNIPGMGMIESGYDGSTAWATDPMQGPRILAGRELDQMREESDFRGPSRDTTVVASSETVADTSMNGERCYLVKLTWKSGRTTNECYSATTGLTVATMNEQQTSMGTMMVTSYLSDWKEFSGIRIATRLVQRMMGQEQIMTITDVRIGKPATEIVAPEAIKALKAAGSTPASPTKP